MLPVRIHFSLGDDAREPAGGELFGILEAVRAGGSIAAAARTLACSYRHLWGRLRFWEARLGRPLIRWDRGRAARLTDFGDKLLWADARIKARLAPELDTLVAGIERELSVAFDDALPIVHCVASHDLALAALRSDALDSRSLILDLRFAGSLDALAALAAGECSFAGIHLPVEHPELAGRGSALHRAFGPLLRRGREKMIRVCGRRQGWMVQRAGSGSGSTSSASSAAGSGPLAHATEPAPPAADTDGRERRHRFQTLAPHCVITREPGSGTRALFDQLAQAGTRLADDLILRTESSHLAVAAAVAAGDAPVGFGIEAAATRFELDFEPVVSEQYFLVCRRETIDAEIGQAVVQALRSASWLSQVAQLPGYDARGAGEIVSLRRVLPWYRR